MTRSLPRAPRPPACRGRARGHRSPRRGPRPFGRRLGRGGAALALLAVSAGLTPSPAMAFRPLVTEDTGVSGRGEVVVELGIEHIRNDDITWALRTSVAAGVLPNLELRIQPGLVWGEGDGSAFGITDTLVGAKYRVIEETERVPAVLLAAGALTPTRTVGGETGEGLDVIALVATSKELGPVSAILNAGYTFVTRDRSLDTWLLAAAGEYHLTKRWSLVAEVVGLLGARRSSIDEVIVRGGGVFALTETIRFDAAVGGGLGAGSSVLFTVGVTLGPF